MTLPADLLPIARKFQRTERTEVEIYRGLARRIGGSNGEILTRIAAEEEEHYERWRELTGVDLPPNKPRVWWYLFLARFLGLAFVLHLLERNEQRVQERYGRLADRIPAVAELLADEERHEHELLDMLHDPMVSYIGSVVLGMNDALVELIGLLSGLTFSLRNTELVAFAALVTGIAAALSMGASEFLSRRAEGDTHALVGATYTFLAYLFTVLALVAPYFLVADYRGSYVASIAIAFTEVGFFSYYIAVLKDESVWRRFGEMAALGFGVAAVSYGVGQLLRLWLGIEV